MLGHRGPTGRQQRGLISPERRTTTPFSRRPSGLALSPNLDRKTKAMDHENTGARRRSHVNRGRCHSASSSCSGAVGTTRKRRGGSRPVPIMGEVGLGVGARRACNLGVILGRSCITAASHASLSRCRPLSIGKPWRRRELGGTRGEPGANRRWPRGGRGAGGTIEDRSKASFCPRGQAQKSILRFTLSVTPWGRTPRPDFTKRRFAAPGEAGRSGLTWQCGSRKYYTTVPSR